MADHLEEENLGTDHYFFDMQMYIFLYFQQTIFLYFLPAKHFISVSIASANNLFQKFPNPPPLPPVKKNDGAPLTYEFIRVKTATFHRLY